MLPDEALERFGLGSSAEAISPALSFRIDVAEDGSDHRRVEAHAPPTVRVQALLLRRGRRLMDAGKAPVLAALAELADMRRRRGASPMGQSR